MTGNSVPTPSRSSSRWIKLLLALGAALAVVVASFAAFSFWKYRQLDDGIRLAPVQERKVQAALDPAPAPKKAEPLPVQYVLFLGGDMRPGETKGRSDTILVARVDPATKQVAMLSIPRDTRVQIPGRGWTKINHAMAYGGPALAIESVKRHTGLPINHFVAVDFRGFADLVDMIGGVRIDVDRAIDDRNGATTGGISNVTKIDAGPQLLDGKQALTYVRSRKYADGDFTRIRHQQAFLKAVATQSFSGSNIGKLPGMADVMAKNVKSDMDLVRMTELARTLKGVDEQSMETTTLPGKPSRIGGISYVVPDLTARDRIVASFKQGLPDSSR